MDCVCSHWFDASVCVFLLMEAYADHQACLSGIIKMERLASLEWQSIRFLGPTAGVTLLIFGLLSVPTLGS